MLKQTLRSLRSFFPHLLESKRLNAQLYQDVRRIDPAELSLFQEKIQHACQTLKYDADYTERWITHTHRLYLSYKEIEKLIKEHAIHTVLDLGEEGLFALILQNSFPTLQITSTHGDLRKDFGVEQRRFDLILATEVFEHISDLPSEYNDAFHASGLKETLYLCKNHLQEEGVLFLTTPNGCSVRALEVGLEGNMPLMYEPHIREYTWNDVKNILKDTGFTVLELKTVHCITVGYNRDYSSLFRYMLDHGYPTTNRGDDAFIVAKKTVMPPGIEGTLYSRSIK